MIRASYTLTQAADKDLYDIYNYTFREIDEMQADAYFSSLQEGFENLGQYPKIGVAVFEVRDGYRRFTHDRHFIYYKSQEGGVLIVRVLGPGMSPSLHLG